jgi:pimeloyl-ACP methyl ester carboxylesterase
MIKVGGIETHFLRAGRGEPVLLLHGLGASSYSWRFVLPELAKHYEVFAPDLPGFGRSEKPWDFDYSIAGLHRWVISFMDAMGIKKARFAGNSMGGVVSLWTALETPERLDRMALIGAPAYPENRPKILGPLSWPIVGSFYERFLGEWSLRWIVNHTFVNKSVATPELLAEYGAPLKSAAGRRAVAEFVRRCVPPDWKARVARYAHIRQPALVLVGDHDSLVDRESGERLARDLGAAKFHFLERCGHAAQEDAPDRVVPLLKEFFA